MSRGKDPITFSEALESLGLDSHANFADVRRAYRLLSLKHHPDRIHDQSQKPGAERRFMRIRDAYEFLKNHRYLLQGPERKSDPLTGGRPSEDTPEARAERLIRRYRELNDVRPSPLADIVCRWMDFEPVLVTVWMMYAALVIVLLFIAY